MRTAPPTLPGMPTKNSRPVRPAAEARRADLVAHVPKLARPGDLVLTLGAGDLTTVPDEWLAEA